MECRARDLYDFVNVAWQPVDIRKARKSAMNSEIALNMTYKTHIRIFRIFVHEKQWIEKIAKLLSHRICLKLPDTPATILV